MTLDVRDLRGASAPCRRTALSPSKKNQTSFGTGWPDFATVVSQP